MLRGHPVPSHAVDRPALRARLDAALTAPLAVIVAQAGSGKSVLLAQWAQSHPDTRMIWVDVVAADDDPAHFARQLFTALAGIDPSFADLAPMIALGDGGLGRPLLDALAIQLAETGEIVIVLDDLHHLGNHRILGDLATLVDLLPPTTHLVVSSRGDFPSSFRRGVDPGVIEIRQADMAIGFADSSELLKRVTGRTISTESVRALISRTEGWVAGLLLAGVTLRSRDDAEEFTARFAGSDRLVVEYLGDSVMRAQTADRQLALLRMSVLDQMSAELVDHLFGELTTQSLFEEMEASSMFLVALDDRREWFRFHHLFGDMLRYRYRAGDPSAERPILIRAAAWHLERGDTPAAIEYLLRAKQWDDAIDVILGQGPAVFERGEMATVVRWIEQIPDTLLARRPDVVTIRGILKGLDGQAVEAEDILRLIANDPGTPFGLVVCAQAFIASLAQWRPHPETSVRNARLALELLNRLGAQPTPNLLNLSDRRSLEAIALFSGGRAHFLAGDFDQARNWLTRALASDGAAYSLWRISALGSLALVEAWAGRLRLAETMATEALAIAKNVGSLAHPSIGDSYLALALVAIERGDAGGASLLLHEGIARAVSNGRVQLLWVAYLLQSILHRQHPRADDMPEPEGPPPPVVRERLDALQSDRPAAGELGAPRAAAADRPLEAVQYLLGQALRAERDGDPARCSALLRRALTIAEPEQLVEVFVRAGDTIVGRVQKMAPGVTTLRPAIIKRARQLSEEGMPAVQLPDPLTEREVEILGYLPTYMNAAELAEECFVSVSTIKTHVAHIYTKLGVTSRGGAVRRARELQLIPAAD